MADFLGMGGYAAYVWTSYAVFFIVLLLDAVAPVMQRRRALRQLQSRMKRESARRTMDKS